MKNKKIIIITILIISAISLVVLYYKTDINIAAIRCMFQNGRIVNTLEERCNQNEKNVGKLRGYACPCICCLPK